MAIRTTVDIPESLHDRLRHRAEQAGTSIRALIIRALEQTYSERG
jgi:predicted HicB family RNase H-like nuclease